MKFFRKFALAIFLAILLNIFGSMYIEYCSFRDKQTALREYIRLSYDSAISSVQSVDYSGLSSVTVDPQDVREYCDILAGQNAGISRSAELTRVLKFMRDSTNSKAGIFTPIQFGMTYINKAQFTKLFKDNLNEYIKLNYGDGNTEGIRGNGTLQLTNVTVDVGQPQLIRLDDSNNGVLLAGIFGTMNTNVLGMQGSNQSDSRFKYAVGYTIKIHVSWSSVSTSPFFKNAMYRDTYNGANPRLKDQALIHSRSPLMYHRQFMLVN